MARLCMALDIIGQEGICLNVHERIMAQLMSSCGTSGTAPGMLITNEPGLYKANEITRMRIENVMLVRGG